MSATPGTTVGTSLFLEGWSVAPDRDGRLGEYRPVTLPHDAMIGEQRRSDAPSWAHGGYFPGGRYRYRRTWAPAPQLTGRCVSLVFEGVYRRSRVLLDGVEVGGTSGGYREFEAPLGEHLRPGDVHVIEVDVDNRDTPSARWYTGSGLYRPVWLDVREPVHLRRGGTSVRTRLDGSTAHVQVDVALTNPVSDPLDVVVVLRGPSGTAVRATTSTGGTSATAQLVVDDARTWSAETPVLHDLEVVVARAGVEQDRQHHRVGLRSLELVPGRGLLVNGTVVELRGANVHHDNGVLGAATLPGAERRRMRILKDCGFNAVRSAHNPASRALLEACDELGLYVMDEAFDGWYDHKTEQDDADLFEDGWRADLEAMVAKDRLHPSVVMYSVGNENGEALTPRGRRVTAAMTAELRRLDPDRFTTIGVNLVAAAFAGIAGGYARETEVGTGAGGPSKAAPDMTSTALNAISNRFGVLMKHLPRLRAADRSTRELFEHVDVAGYNYGTSRYETDAAAHPHRLMVGTESMPGDLARNWGLVQQLPALVGDFVWAGWDYIGEAGGGTWSYGTRRAPFLKPYPQLTSGMGVVDITGVPGAAVLLARAAWGQADAPAIAVRPLDVPVGPVARTAWRSTDAVQSWSWSGHEGRPATVEVYSADEEVELRLNGRSLGRRPAGRAHGFVARFETRYEGGVLEAVGLRRGRPTSSARLRSAGPVHLRLRPEGTWTDDPLGTVHVWVELADEAGTVDSAARDQVTVRVDGPATLVGFGSAAPADQETFTGDRHSTYRGRALAVVRRTGRAGPVQVVADSLEHGSTCVALTAPPTSSTAPSPEGRTP